MKTTQEMQAQATDQNKENSLLSAEIPFPDRPLLLRRRLTTEQYEELKQKREEREAQGWTGTPSPPETVTLPSAVRRTQRSYHRPVALARPRGQQPPSPDPSRPMGSMAVGLLGYQAEIGYLETLTDGDCPHLPMHQPVKRRKAAVGQVTVEWQGVAEETG